MDIIKNSYKQIVLQHQRWLRVFVFVIFGLTSLLLWVFGMFFLATGEYDAMGIGLLLGSLFSGFWAYIIIEQVKLNRVRFKTNYLLIMIKQVKLSRVRFKRKYLLIPYWHNTVGIRILVAVIITVFFGIWMFSILNSQYKADTKLLNNGSHITARVTEKYVQGGGYDGSDTYYVHYVFSPNGSEELKGSGRINKQNWDQLREGGSIKIAFDPENPSHNLPVLADRSGYWLYYVGTIFLSIFVFFIVLLVLFLLLPRIIRSVRKKYNARSNKEFWQDLETESEAMEDFWGHFTNSNNTD